MYWPEVDFKFSEIAKFGPLLAQKRQNWGKFFYLQTPKKGVFWPFLALLLGTPSQALKILTVLGCLEKVYQVSRPGKANQLLFGAFSVKRMILYKIGAKKVLPLLSPPRVLVLKGWNLDSDPTQYSRLHIFEIVQFGQGVLELGQNLGQNLDKIAITW